MKRRQLICGRNPDGDGGCGAAWFTYGIPETVLADAFTDVGSGSGGQRGRKKKSA